MIRQSVRLLLTVFFFAKAYAGDVLVFGGSGQLGAPPVRLLTERGGQ